MPAEGTVLPAGSLKEGLNRRLVLSVITGCKAGKGLQATVRMAQPQRCLQEDASLRAGVSCPYLCDGLVKEEEGMLMPCVEPCHVIECGIVREMAHHPPGHLS